MPPGFEKVVGFQWDADNEDKNATKHSVAQSEAEQAFANQPLIVADDPKHSQSETRFRALGKTNAGRLLHVVFTIRGDLIRVISARPMNRKERRIYESES
jgi:uncharacterized DUF497 family protein